jgi:hypothetical protein
VRAQDEHEPAVRTQDPQDPAQRDVRLAPQLEGVQGRHVGETSRRPPVELSIIALAKVQPYVG